MKMGFFDNLWSAGTEAVASVGDAVAAGANQVGDALDYVDNVGHATLGEYYDYIPIISDVTSIGADAAHETADAANLVSDVSRGKETFKGAVGRATDIGTRMANTGVDAGVAYTAGRVGGAAGKTWGKAVAKGAEKALGKVGAKVATQVGKQVIGSAVGHEAAKSIRRTGK